VRHNPIIWAPKRIANQLKQWLVERASDGFVISISHVPRVYEDFVRFVVPELQHRGDLT
jgi:alkanesulfonate monooxygenase SsuD/methylene tetrahydromethanopterin reductase-like flavin-dependent oxidoreductase (luciferase family)